METKEKNLEQDIESWLLSEGLREGQYVDLWQEKDQSVVARHLNNAIRDGELEESNMHILHNTQYKYRPTKVYDLDAIITVGYLMLSNSGFACLRPC